MKKRHELEVESIREKIAAITQDLQKERQRSNALEEALAMVGSSQDPASKSSEELLDWSPSYDDGSSVAEDELTAGLQVQLRGLTGKAAEWTNRGADQS